MNRFVIELHPEDRARLDALIAGLEKLQPNCESCVDNVLRVAEDLARPTGTPTAPAAVPAEAAPPVDLPAPEAPAPAKVPAAKPPSLAEFQAMVTDRCVKNPALKPQVRELVNRYAESVSEIPAEKRLVFLEQLAAL